MSSPDTRTPALTQAHIDRIIAALEQRGASVNVSDPRVSAVQAWIFGLVGAGVVAAALWGAQSLATLSAAVSAAVARLDHQSAVLADHEQRLRDQERKP